jgi:threonine synthase
MPGDDIDHVLRRTIDARRVAFPEGSEPNPFVRYRTLFHAYHVARGVGWSDNDYVGLVERLDRAVAAVDGRGFVATPLRRADALAAELGLTGPVLVKDETGNVSGSHKARHLMGTAIELEVADALERMLGVLAGAAAGGRAPTRLAIASCGNAALAAAVVARAWGRPLEVFVPANANPAVVERLARLGAEITTVGREHGVHGDPTYRLLERAVEGGATAFTCQGPQNGFAIEGGLTLGYEIASDLRANGRPIDRLFVQVGGGALASSCVQALDEAVGLGALGWMPRIHAVQTTGAWPLVRAYDRAAAWLARRLQIDVAVPTEPGAATPSPCRRRLAEHLRRAVGEPHGAVELDRMARHRSAFMRPWEVQPHSVASGILDDETYDWFAVVAAMLRTGGYPLVVSEETLRTANELARRTTGIDVDHTGSAGLAGLIELHRAGAIRSGESLALLFTGVRRSSTTPSRATASPNPVGAARGHQPTHQGDAA